MPGKVLWDPKMKGFGPITMEFGIAWCYMSLNPPFSPEHLCNLAPFQSECITWEAGSILPLKIPNVLFSENSLFLSEAALGCCSRFLEPNRTSQSSWERQVLPGSSRFTPGMRTCALRFFAGLPPCLHVKTTAPPSTTHPQPPKPWRDNPKGMVSSQWCFHILFLTVESSFQIHFFFLKSILYDK